MKAQESGNFAGQPAGTGTTEHRSGEEEELPGQYPHNVPEGLPENGSGRSGGTGPAGLRNGEETGSTGQIPRADPDGITKKGSGNPDGPGMVDKPPEEEKGNPGHYPPMVPQGMAETGPGRSNRTGESEISRKQKKGLSGQDLRTEKFPRTKTPEGGTAITGERIGKNVSPDKKPVISCPVDDVERKTELQGTSATSAPYDPSRVRKRTERDLRDPGFEIPYARTEKAVRDLVCSLLERQDRMNVSIFLEINSMNEDIGMLKDQLYKLRTMKTGTDAGAKK